MKFEQSCDCVLVVNGENVWVADFMTEEVAAYVVRACNAHDGLVAALKIAQVYVNNEAGEDEIRKVEEALAAAGEKP